MLIVDNYIIYGYVARIFPIKRCEVPWSGNSIYVVYIGIVSYDSS